MVGGDIEDGRATKKPGEAADLVNTHRDLDAAAAEKLMRFLHPDERRVRFVWLQYTYPW